MSYTYHSSVPGLRTGLTAQQPSGNWSQSYAYDAAKRLQTLTAPMGNFSYTYQGAGNLWTNLALPNTSKIIQTFDNVARLTGTHLKNSSGTTLNSHQYFYNAAHQRTRHTRTDASYVSFTYDNLSQLLTAVGSGGQSTENLGYLYDSAWNLSVRTNNGAPTSFSVNGKNELTAVGSVNYFYDGNGNLSSTSDYRSYSWDDENQLTKVEQFQNWKTEFTYDGRQRLRVRQDYTWNAGYGAWQLSAETRYVYDGMRVIQERNSSNVPTVAYTRGVDLSGTMEGAGGIGGLLARSHGYSGGSWSTHSYYHADGGGNVTYLVNSGQAMVASYRYDPYGRLLSSSGSLASANVMRFSSKAWIAHNGSATDGLYYYGYRFYDPNVQRWPNRDPIGEDGGVNLYRFVQNSPIVLSDPFGLKEKESKKRQAIRKALDAIGDAVEKGKRCKEILDEIKEAVKNKRKLNPPKPGDASGGLFGIYGIPAAAVAGLEAFADSSDCRNMLNCCKCNDPNGCVEKAQGCALDIGIAMGDDTSPALGGAFAEWLEGTLIKRFCKVK